MKHDRAVWMNAMLGAPPVGGLMLMVWAVGWLLANLRRHG